MDGQLAKISTRRRWTLLNLVTNILLLLNFYFGNEAMPIRLEEDLDRELLDTLQQNTSLTILIVDKNIIDLWGRSIEEGLRLRNCKYLAFDIEPTEQSKNLSLVGEILSNSLEAGADRNTTVVAIGGGLTANIAGMVAGLMYRGVKLIHVPTTLLSMSDAILSKKQAVNADLVKNAIGLYVLPKATLISTKYLTTLPEEQLSAGMLELLKNILAFDFHSYDHVLELWDRRSYADLVRYGICSKQTLLKNDKHEIQCGILLEYGHTFGHAIEISSNITHGHAVGIGMIAAAFISNERGLISYQDLERHIEGVNTVGGLTSLPRYVDQKCVLKAIQKDNKRGKINHDDNQCPMIILKSLGQACYTNELPLCVVEMNEVEEAISYITHKNL